MVVGKKKAAGPRHLISQSSAGVFDESVLYQLITSSPAEQVTAAMREAIFTNDEDVHLACPDTGMTYLHLVADNYQKFIDPRALPAVYMLCYVGIDVSAQDKDEGETVLHKLVRKPGAHKIILALLRYGVDTTLRNRQGQTAEEYLEYEQPPGYKETLHWMKKLSPGLHHILSGDSQDTLSLDQVKGLLEGWCKVKIFNKGKPVNLLQTSQMRARDAVLAELLKKHYWTNEFVHATLAGLPAEMRSIHKEAGKKRVDVDTLDHCYQLDMDSPMVPQPLVAAAWEQGNYDVIDQLLLFDADVCTSYSNQPDTNPVKPLFYQTLLGTPRVWDVNIMIRILQEGDLRCKTEDSTTFLHESVKYSLPAPFVAKLFSLDVPLEERDGEGLTARERAVAANKQDLVQVMDDVVIHAAKEGDIKKLETIVMQFYEIQDVKAADGRSLMEMAVQKEFPTKVSKFLQTIPEMQAHMLRLWDSVYRNDLVLLKKYLTNKDLKRYVYSRNRCGRSILLLSIVNKNKEAIRMILKKHHKLVEYFDNYMLTCLHYAYLMFEEDYEVAQQLKDVGASVDWCCTHGHSAYFFQKHIMEESQFQNAQSLIIDVPFVTFPEKDAFKAAFVHACIKGNQPEIERLAQLFRPYGSISLLCRPYLLLDVIDAGQEGVAIYLIENGCDSSVTKQYEECELCPMLECFHPNYTILDRAKLNQLHGLCNYITQRSLASCGVSDAAVDMEVDPETGMSNHTHQMELLAA